MNLLPKSSKEFSSKQYWDEFFSKRGSKAFEWYGEYAELCGHLHKYIKPTDKILVAGCGNSTISADLYKFGFKHITNVDISEIVIRQMRDKYKDECSEMEWVHGDVLNLQYDNESFSCILDKGTLDALMSQDTPKVISEAQLYFQEIGRVLRFGGRYICISLLQEHILSTLLSWFSQNGFFIRFCRCEEAEKIQLENGAFSFPVFFIVCTKFKLMPNFKPVIELNLNEGQLSRVSESEVKESVTSFQQFALLKHKLKKKLVTGEEMNLDLYDSKSNKKRYSLFIVDSPKITNERPFAAFIVPHGRETEWLFKTRNGQLQLAETASCSRLVVVHLNRDQEYGTIDQVKSELSPKVLELAPARLPKNYKIPFLSVGEDLGERKEVFRGTSSFSGEFVVEDVNDESSKCHWRRLVFLQNQNLVQSEAKLIREKKKKKTLIMDPSYLACAHHSVMLTSLQLVSYKSSLLLVGLGGGALATYIHTFFPEVTLTCLDIDEEMVKVAEKWFSFKSDAKLRSVVEDGIQFITKAEKKGEKYDIIMFDVDSKELSEGLSCPPRMFVEKEFLKKVANTLTKKGIFALNLVCRDPAIKKDIIGELKEVFGTVFSVAIPEEVNVVLFCRVAADSSLSERTFQDRIKTLNDYLKAETKSHTDVLELRDMMNSFQIVH